MLSWNFSASSLKKQSAGRHVGSIKHTIWANHSVLLLIFAWPNRILNPHIVVVITQLSTQPHTHSSKCIIRFVWQHTDLYVHLHCGFLASFNNISVILWRLVLLVEETRVPSENQQPVASHWQTLSYTAVVRVHLAWFELTTLVVICTDCIGSYNYHMITSMTVPSICESKPCLLCINCITSVSNLSNQ